MPSDATLAAEAFARDHTSSAHPFDFSLDSLLHEVDWLLDSGALSSADEKIRWKAEAALGAYIGETLSRLFGGTWAGTFRDDNPGPNWYLSWVEFGSYKFYPSHHIGYRLSDGRSEPTFAQYLHNVLPEIRARQDT